MTDNSIYWKIRETVISTRAVNIHINWHEGYIHSKADFAELISYIDKIHKPNYIGVVFVLAFFVLGLLKY